MSNSDKREKTISATSYKLLNKRNIIAFILCLVGVLINVIFVKIAAATGAPIYLDTVGTILVSVFGGALPGILVGFLTNAVKCISDPSSLYYGILNITIAILASFFAKRGWFRKPLKFIAAILIFAAIGGGLGTIIPWCLSDVGFETASLGEKLYDMGGFSVEAAQLTANIIIDLIDKTISMLIVLVVSLLIPEHIKKKFSFFSWKQNPLSEEDSSVVQESKSRLVSLQTKILLLLTAALFLVSLASTVISSILYRRELIDEYSRTADGIASLTSKIVDGNSVDEYIASGGSSQEYKEVSSQLYDILHSSDDIEYIYVYKIEEDGCHVVFDLDTADLAGDDVGDVIPFDKSFEPYIDDLLNGRKIEPIVSNDTYGHLLTVYKPVFDSRGKCTCYAAADISMKRIKDNERGFIVGIISLFLSIFIVIVALAWHLIEYHIILPINSMSLKTGTFAYNYMKDNKNSVDDIKALDIQTGDEIENLYHAIVKTSEDSVRYVTDIKQKNETISQMQRSLILVLADMVENRDKNTGDHIKKTAVYTEIVMKEMRKKGYYSDVLTDDFIENVVSAAPLHDIGKIKIPDAILNKPGKLTDEEFEKMKYHSLAGGEIIERVAEEFTDSTYLSVAKSIAVYHHEKWNGRGYPYGVSGENIPLSARIMAVADVFDALVSRRCYKPPFTFEKAMDIIREGAGEHFDPKVADAFLSAADEIRKVAEDFDSKSAQPTE